MLSKMIKRLVLLFLNSFCPLPNNVHHSVLLHESIAEQCPACGLNPFRTLDGVGRGSRNVDAIAFVGRLVRGRGPTALDHQKELDHHRLVDSEKEKNKISKQKFPKNVTIKILRREQRLINLKIPVLVRSLKSSNVELG